MAFVSDSTEKSSKAINNNPGTGFYEPFPERGKLEQNKRPFDSGLDRFISTKKSNNVHGLLIKGQENINI